MKVIVSTIFRYEYECEVPDGLQGIDLLNAVDDADPIAEDVILLENKGVSIVEYTTESIMEADSWNVLWTQ